MLPARKIWCATVSSAILALAVSSTLVYADPAPEPRVVSPDDNKWIVPNAEVILKLNVKQMMASELMKKTGTDAIKQLIDTNEQAKKVIDATGVDVTKDVEAILVSATGGSAKDAKGRIVIRGKFNPTKIHDALKQQADKGASVKVLKEGTTPIYEFQLNDDRALYGAFVDRSVMVLTESKESTTNLVKNPPAKAAALSPRMKSALIRFTGKESMSVALVVNNDLKKMLGAARGAGDAASKLQTLTASLTLTDGVALNVTGVTSDVKSAGQLAKTLEALKTTGVTLLGMNDDVPPFVGDVINAVKIGNNKDRVAINLKITKETINKVVPSDK